MRRFFLIASASVALLFSAHGADLTIFDGEIICLFGDSWFEDSGGNPDNSISGHRVPDWLCSFLALNNPTLNLAFYNFSRSGGSLDEMLTNRVQRFGFPAWGYASNNFHLLGVASMTDNGGTPNSNQIYLSLSNIFQAPALMSDGGSLTLATHTGWAATHTIEWIALGEPPEEGADGDPRQQDRNNGATNAGWTLGSRGIDVWNPLSQAWTNDYISTGGTNVQWLPRGGHFANGGAKSWVDVAIKGITSDTNISTCTVDWSGSIGATNHCVISGVSVIGNTMTFNRHDDRLPMAWDMADGTITNDARTAFNLNPSDGNLFRFTLKITGLPAGNYQVLIDGVVVAAQISSVEFSSANGWNMYTNYVGPYWAQRKEVLGRIRDVWGYNRITLIPIGGQGLQGVGDTMNTAWNAGHRGDQLLADTHDALAHLYTNSVNSFAAVHAAAQPTNHTFSIQLITPRFAPYHR